MQASVDRLVPKVKEPQDEKKSYATESEEEKNYEDRQDAEEVEESK